MTCIACESALQSNPRSGITMLGCVSCEGRVLAALGLHRDQLAAEDHAPDVIAAFEAWLPIVKSAKNGAHYVGKTA